MAEPEMELLRRIVGKIVIRHGGACGESQHFWRGLGLALDICHEVVTGAPATRLEVLDWARAFAKFDNEDQVRLG